MQALVGSVGIAERVFDAEQQRRSAIEQVGERAHEADGATTTDAHGVVPVTASKCAHCSFESRSIRIGHPPVAMRAGRFHGYFDTPRWIRLEKLGDLPFDFFRLLIGNDPATHNGRSSR